MTDVAIGQRVIALGSGALAEEAVVAARDVFPMPDKMSFAEGAGFAVAYGTSHVGLARRVNLGAGEKLLVLGASGGVGLAAVEVGKAIGATVIACASSAEKLEVAKSRGADILINYASENLRERVKSLGGVEAFAIRSAARPSTLRCGASIGKVGYWLSASQAA